MDMPQGTQPAALAERIVKGEVDYDDLVDVVIDGLQRAGRPTLPRTAVMVMVEGMCPTKDDVVAYLRVHLARSGGRIGAMH